jgi:transglutaminase-like putative cysteine protease
MGSEERVLDGVKTKVYSVKTLLKPIGMDSVSVLSETGELLEDHIGGGMITMRLEPEAVAKDVKYQNDTIVSNAAMVKAPIRDPRERDALRLRIRGPLTSDQMFNDAGQRFTPDGDGWLFDGRKAFAPAGPVRLPVPGSEAEQWLRPTLYVQSDDPKMIAKAREIVGEEKDTLKIVEKIVHWVSDNMRSTFSARLTNALEVLNSMEGDCTEHSVLFVGLARAAGVPAREVAGLIYADSPQPGFYFHQWAKVWVGTWMDVDPTFNEVFADATHIKLSEGDLAEQVRLLPVIGKISIEVVGD